MAALIYLDTHVVAWLYAGSVDHFTETAKERLQFGFLRISPMVQLELQYLYETRRTTRPGEAVVNDLVKRMGLAVCDRSFPEVVQSASRQTWTRDPFDRLIVGHAALENSPLLTKDRTIHMNYSKAVW